MLTLETSPAIAELTQIRDQFSAVFPDSFAGDDEEGLYSFPDIWRAIHFDVGKILEDNAYNMGEPRDLLPGAQQIVRSTHAMAVGRECPDIRVEWAGVACDEAEKCISTTVERLVFDRLKPNDLRATVIYCDVDGEPAGIQKTAGEPTVFFWRDARIATQDSVIRIPGHSIVQTSHEYGDEETSFPREKYRGVRKEAVLLKSMTAQPEFVEFLRFHTSIFSQVVQDSFIETDPDSYPPVTSTQEVAQKIAKVIKRGNVLVV